MSNQGKRLKGMSLEEKVICLLIMGRQPLLPYPLRQFVGSDGVTYKEYKIPTEKKQEVLNELYPLFGPPDLDTVLLDIHECKEFRVGDYKVLRYRNSNLLVSPYFPQSGGMFIDWESPDMREGYLDFRRLRIFNGKPIDNEKWLFGYSLRHRKPMNPDAEQ